MQAMVADQVEHKNEKKLPKNMRLSLVWKAFCIKPLVLCVALSSFSTSFSQVKKDSLPYRLFNDKIVLYSDFGYTGAPFTLKYPFQDGVDNLHYKNNFRAILGLGGSYKWFSMRVGIPLPIEIRSAGRFGHTLPINLGVDFTIKKTFFDVDFRNFKGYAIKDAYTWNDTLTKLKPNDIRSSTSTNSFSINVWYFHNKDFKMQALRGRNGHYEKSVHTWYLRNTFNVFGVGNQDQPVIPVQFKDSLNTKLSASSFGAVDIGVIPGYAYVNRVNNWQFSFLAGVGGVVQTKFYTVDGVSRSFTGLQPRYDIRFIGGYSEPRYFVFLVTDFDNKSIHFNSLIYNQTFYTLRLVGGIRLEPKEKKSSRK
jgi:hypothetical protein